MGTIIMMAGVKSINMPINSRKPAPRPPKTTNFRPGRGIILADAGRWSRLISSSGSREREPRVNRAALKVKGPRYSMPTRWATNAKPQMAAVINSRALDLTV